MATEGSERVITTVMDAKPRCRGAPSVVESETAVQSVTAICRPGARTRVANRGETRFDPSGVSPECHSTTRKYPVSFAHSSFTLTTSCESQSLPRISPVLEKHVLRHLILDIKKSTSHSSFNTKNKMKIGSAKFVSHQLLITL